MGRAVDQEEWDQRIMPVCNFQLSEWTRKDNSRMKHLDTLKKNTCRFILAVWNSETLQYLTQLPIIAPHNI